MRKFRVEHAAEKKPFDKNSPPSIGERYDVDLFNQPEPVRNLNLQRQEGLIRKLLFVHSSMSVFAVRVTM